MNAKVQAIDREIARIEAELEGLIPKAVVNMVKRAPDQKDRFRDEVLNGSDAAIISLFEADVKNPAFQFQDVKGTPSRVYRFTNRYSKTVYVLFYDGSKPTFCVVAGHDGTISLKGVTPTPFTFENLTTARGALKSAVEAIR